MDQPAPVSAGATISKFDFGKPVAPAAPVRQEPLSTLSERLAAHDPVPPPRVEPAAGPAPRIPSSLTPVSENKSFGEGPSVPVAKPGPAVPPAAAPVTPAAPAAAPAPGPTDFSFDFGFAKNPPTASAPPRAIPPQPQPGPPPMLQQEPEEDPIAALIEADMTDGASDAEAGAGSSEHEPETAEADEPAVVTPIRPAPAPAPTGSMPSAVGAAPPVPLKPMSAPPRPPESDRFAVSPGAGISMKPQPGQPLAAPQPRTPEPMPIVDDSDPMSEIESLIGEAVRVELGPGPVRVQAAQTVAPKVSLEPEDEVEDEIASDTDEAEEPIHEPSPAPVVPPLTTQFAPRRANLKDDAAARSAEDAILAATAAAGAEPGRVEPSIGDESPYRRLKVKPQRGGMLSGGVRQYVGMAVAGTLLLAAGLGLYWVLNMGRPATGTGANAPVLTADTSPVKEVPPASSKPQTDVAKSPVLAKMDNATPAPSSEQLVSTDQATNVTRDVTPSADDTEGGLANRKVRTVTVRPDGTIVSGDDAVAGAAELPVDRPNVPAVPSTETTNLLGDQTQTAAASTDSSAVDPLVPSALAAQDTQVAEASPSIDPTLVAPTPMSFPVRSTPSRTTTTSTTPSNSNVNALVGAQTPNGQIDLLGGNGASTAPQQVASANPASTVSDPNSAPAYVQLSAQPTEADAKASIRAVTAKYGSLFGGNQLVIQQVDLGQKGVRWRVRLPAGSLTEATNICAQIKAQGGDCFATNG